MTLKVLYIIIPLICRVSGISQRIAFTSLWWIQNVKIIQKLIFIIFLQERKCLLKYQTSVVGWDNCAKDTVAQGKKISCLPCPRRPQRIWDYNHQGNRLMGTESFFHNTKHYYNFCPRNGGLWIEPIHIWDPGMCCNRSLNVKYLPLDLKKK